MSEVAQPHPEGHQVDPSKMKRFVLHLANSSRKVESRAAVKTKVKHRLEKIKSMALNKRTKKVEIESEINDFDKLFSRILRDEESILEEQRRETQELKEVREQIQNLSAKVAIVAQAYGAHIGEKDGKILDLKESLVQANMRLSESGVDRKERIAAIERKIKQKPGHHVGEVETHLASLEDKHDKMKKSGKFTKKDMDRLKKVIDKHKTKISKLK